MREIGSSSLRGEELRIGGLVRGGCGDEGDWEVFFEG